MSQHHCVPPSHSTLGQMLLFNLSIWLSGLERRINIAFKLFLADVQFLLAQSSSRWRGEEIFVNALHCTSSHYYLNHLSKTSTSLCPTPISSTSTSSTTTSTTVIYDPQTVSTWVEPHSNPHWAESIRVTPTIIHHSGKHLIVESWEELHGLDRAQRPVARRGTIKILSSIYLPLSSYFNLKTCTYVSIKLADSRPDLCFCVWSVASTSNDNLR